MKNLIKKCLIILSSAAILAAGTVSYASDTVRGSEVHEYNGRIYSSVNTRCNGLITDKSVWQLPSSIMSSGDVIYQFAFYYDRIYYLKGVPGSDNVLGYICSCNVDGSDIRLIADNADALSSFYISDGCIYYEVLYDYDNSHGRYLNGGIMKINLNTGGYAKIITDRDGWLRNIVDDNIFYGVDTLYHLMKTNGRYVGEISDSDIEVSTVISGATGYFGSNGSIYSRDWDGNTKWIASVPNYVNGYGVYSDSASVMNVAGGYIYYTLNSRGMMANYTDVALMKVPVSGGASTLVATWFIS